MKLLAWLLGFLLVALAGGSSPLEAQEPLGLHPPPEDWDLERDVKPYLEEHGWMERYDRLATALKGAYRSDQAPADYTEPRYVLRALRGLFADPVRISSIVFEWYSGISAALGGGDPDLVQSVALLADAIDAPLGAANPGAREAHPLPRDPESARRGEPAARPPEPDHRCLPRDAESCLKDLEGRLEAVRTLLEESLAALTREERNFLAQAVPAFAEDWTSDIYVNGGNSAHRAADNRRLLRLTGKVDYRKLAEAASAATVLSEAGFLEDLRYALAPLVPGEGLWSRNTHTGRMVVAGSGPNLHREAATLIVDLGGDDRYEGIGGASEPAGPVVSVVIDLGGDDEYRSHGFSSQGAGFLGLGLLIEAAGDDLYEAGRLAQGGAFFGAGILVDLQGNDRYQAGEFAQGSATAGIALLADGGGDDSYSAALYAQGFGSTKGIGLLWDGSGNDRYVTLPAHPSGWGYQDEFKGLSQGLGVGHRNLAAGGIGLLLDGSGDDLYRAGEIAQGGGYYLGLGALVDAGGNDSYAGTTYAQGFGLHSAAGLLADLSGDDRYVGTKRNGQGEGFDAAIGALLDLAGNDRHEANVFGQGSSNANGFGIFVDRAGRDEYVGVAVRGFAGSFNVYGSQAEGGPDRGAGNLALFLDEGGDADLYRGPGGNGAVRAASDLGVFIDR